MPYQRTWFLGLMVDSCTTDSHIEEAVFLSLRVLGIASHSAGPTTHVPGTSVPLICGTERKESPL